MNETILNMDTLEFPITMSQQGANEFTVTYGRQIKGGLDYNQAASELGYCILHALACEGKLDI